MTPSQVVAQRVDVGRRIVLNLHGVLRLLELDILFLRLLTNDGWVGGLGQGRDSFLRLVVLLVALLVLESRVARADTFVHGSNLVQVLIS